MQVLRSVNGREVSQAEWDEALGRKRGNLQDILESRRAPGGHAPYWGTGHESISSGVPAIQAKEHHDWCQAQGLKGVEIRPDGTAVTSSPRNREDYLAARGLYNASNDKLANKKQDRTRKPAPKKIRRPS